MTSPNESTAPPSNPPDVFGSEPLFHVEPLYDGGAGLTLTGELDVSAKGHLSVAAGECWPSGSEILVDLSAVTFLDSGGISALADVQQLGGQLVVVRPTAESPRKMLTLAVAWGWLRCTVRPPRVTYGREAPTLRSVA